MVAWFFPDGNIDKQQTLGLRKPHQIYQVAPVVYQVALLFTHSAASLVWGSPLSSQDLRPDIITQNTVLTAGVGILSDEEALYRIHVWYIYLHLEGFSGKVNVGKYTIPGSYGYLFLFFGNFCWAIPFDCQSTVTGKGNSAREPQKKPTQFRLFKSYIQMYFLDFKSFQFPCNKHFIC